MESWEDLATWRAQLNEEEEFITKLLAEIDEQINCLQVEQMELLSNMRNEVQSEHNVKLKTEAPVDKTSEKLDLTIPTIKKDYVEEEEEEEEEENEREEDEDEDEDEWK